MTTKLKNNEEIKSHYDQLFGQMTEQDKLENQASLLMFRFLSIIETKREEFGWSRKELAEKIGTSASYITQLFRGDKLVNMITLVKFQNVLGIEFDIDMQRSYEETVKDFSKITDAQGFWVYHKFGVPNYDSAEILPVFEQDLTSEVA
ncbi:MAG: helix-turn-helix transcriptional regulator [Mariniphaga sp.]